MPRKLFAQVTVAGRDGAIDFEVTEHALNAMRDLQSVRAFGHNRSSLDALTGRDDSLDLPFGKIGTVGIGIAAFVCVQSIRRARAGRSEHDTLSLVGV